MRTGPATEPFGSELQGVPWPKLRLWGKRAFGVFLLCATTTSALPAQTFTTLFSFDGTDGQSPEAALIQATDGNLYGTTFGGGPSCFEFFSPGCGTVFQITLSGTLTTLSSGGMPLPGAALIQATDGNFYGTTSAGGANFFASPCIVSGTAVGCGTVFTFTPTGGFTTLYSFCLQLNCTDGDLPNGLVQGTDGNFYGTTFAGAGNYTCNGSIGCGTIFKITSSGTLTTLYTFCSQSSCTDGSEPHAPLVQGADGNFYGTTVSGGAYGAGTVFEMTPSGALTTLYTFCSQSGCTDGAEPFSGLVQGTDGSFYGTTLSGGANTDEGNCNVDYGGCGTVFKITPSGTLTTLYSFCAQTNCTDGRLPTAGLVQGTDGNFYGTTDSGGSNGGGTIFKTTPTGTPTTLYSFCSQSGCPDGEYPGAALVQAANGNFYGTTTFGGNGNCFYIFNGCGTVFSLSQAQVQLSPTTLSFPNQPVGTTSSPMPVTLTITGYGTLTINSIMTSGDFGQTNTCGSSVAAGASCTISVTFNPTAPGTRTGTLTISDRAPGGPQIVSLTGTGVVAVATVAPTSLAFASQNVGVTSSGQTVILSNTGSAALTISSIAVSGANGGDFAQTSTCGGSVAAGQTCTITVTFTPSAAGARGATLTVTDNSNGVAGSTQSSTLTGTGTAAEVSLSESALAFNAEVVGAASQALSLTLTNSGNAALTISSITVSGPDAKDFALQSSSTCSTTTAVAAGKMCTISLVFTPSAAGSRNASLTIADNANNGKASTQAVVLSGTGQDFTLGPYNLTQTVNPGAGTSYLFKVGPLGGFNQAVSLTCSGVPQAATCTVSPASVVLDGRTHAVITLEVSTTAPTGTVRWGGRGRGLPPFRPLGGQWLWLGGLGLGIVALMARRRRLVLASTLTLLAGMTWASCGGGTASSPAVTPGTPAGTYTLTVNATSGGLSHSTTATLVVQ